MRSKNIHIITDKGITNYRKPYQKGILYLLSWMSTRFTLEIYTSKLRLAQSFLDVNAYKNISNPVFSFIISTDSNMFKWFSYDY